MPGLGLRGNRYRMGWWAAFIAVSLAGGCSEIPVAGPLASDVIDNSGRSKPSHVDYVVVDVTPDVCNVLAEAPEPSFLYVFGTSSTPSPHTVHVGDTLSITIWEAGTSTLFSSLSASLIPAPRGATLPPLVVEPDGMITVPFAGRVSVVGRTPVEVEHIITARLAGKTSEPQVIVTVTPGPDSAVSVGGEVGRGSIVPLAVNGSRILDVIAAAGGIRIPVNESVIRLTRGDHTASIPYLALLTDPRQNVYLQSGDVLTVARLPNTFTAFGAVGRNFQIPFEADSISAEEAVAKADGLQDQRVDPAGVFVFRYVPAALVERLAPGRAGTAKSDLVPVVFHLDLSIAGGYFLARRFSIHDKDIVYAANARMNEVQKFLNILGSVLAPAATGASVSTAIH